MVGFKLPPQDHKARTLMGDMAALVVTLDPANAVKLPTTMQARRSALAMMDGDKAIRSVNSVIIRQDTADRWLVSFGRKGGWKKVWNFGNGA